jgi:hypothetical protein
MKVINKFLVAMLISWFGCMTANAVIVYTNDFATSAEGWTGVGVTYDAGDQRLEWSFDAQTPPGSQEDVTLQAPAFGDLTYGGVYTITEFTFQYYASIASPAPILISMGNNDYFVYNTFSVVSGLNTVTLTSGWLGDTGQWANIWSNVQFFNITVNRAGFVSQNYGFDDFLVYGTTDDPGPPTPSAIPEPATINLVIFVAVMGYVARRRLRQVALPVAT